MKKLLAMISALAVAATISGCFTPSGLNAEQQKQYAKEMADQTLQELYKYQPEAKEVINKSSGYVVYNTYALDYFFLATENGWGIAVNNKTGEQTFLKDISLGIGPGLGFSVMRNVFVFDNEVDFKVYAESAWALNAKADAVARFSQDGTWDVAALANLTNGARGYKIGYRGLIIEAIIELQRSWKNASLTETK